MPLGTPTLRGRTSHACGATAACVLVADADEDMQALLARQLQAPSVGRAREQRSGGAPRGRQRVAPDLMWSDEQHEQHEDVEVDLDGAPVVPMCTSTSPASTTPASTTGLTARRGRAVRARRRERAEEEVALGVLAAQALEDRASSSVSTSLPTRVTAVPPSASCSPHRHGERSPATGVTAGLVTLGADEGHCYGPGHPPWLGRRGRAGGRGFDLV